MPVGRFSRPVASPVVRQSTRTQGDSEVFGIFVDQRSDAFFNAIGLDVRADPLVNQQTIYMKFISRKARPFFVSLAMTAALLSLNACNDDDEKDAKVKNEFTVDGKATGLKSLFFFYDESAGTNEEEETYYRNEVAFISDGFTMVDGELVGKGSGIDLMVNGGQDVLEEGTYNFTGTEENPAPFQIWDGWLFLSIDTEAETSDEYGFTEAVMVVTKSASTYTIDLTGTAGGKKVKAHYTGAITSFSRGE